MKKLVLSLSVLGLLFSCTPETITKTITLPPQIITDTITLPPQIINDTIKIPVVDERSEYLVVLDSKSSMGAGKFTFSFDLYNKENNKGLLPIELTSYQTKVFGLKTLNPNNLNIHCVYTDAVKPSYANNLTITVYKLNANQDAMSIKEFKIPNFNVYDFSVPLQ